jgi:hypothetical protein
MGTYPDGQRDGSHLGCGKFVRRIPCCLVLDIIGNPLQAVNFFLQNFTLLPNAKMSCDPLKAFFLGRFSKLWPEK